MQARSKSSGRLIALAWLWAACCASLATAQPADSELPAALAAGGELKTNPEHYRLLAQARECMAEGRPDLAVSLWQRVLDEAADTLTLAKVIDAAGPSSSPLAVYMPLAELVERTIVEHGREALAAYRTTADAEARAILAAAPPHDPRALAEVARRFFLSSLGDDAAFALACLALDRHDFLGALDGLEKTLHQHPDSSLPRAQLLMRLAVAAAHVGDHATADRALNDLKVLATERPSEATVDQIAAEIEATRRRAPLSQDADLADWRMVYGNAARTGQMPTLAASATSGTLAEFWSQDFPLASLTPSPGSAATGGYLALDPFDRTSRSDGREAAAAHSRSEMISRWRAGGWRPTGRLLFAADRVYFKAPDRMVCFSTAQLVHQPLWQSAWQNRYELDATGRFLALVRMRMSDGALVASSPEPASLAEILLFGDRVHQAMAVADDQLYTIEGRRQTTAVRPDQRQPFSLHAAPRRARSNWLTAYQAAGGKAVWTRSAADENQADASETGFLSAPTPCGDNFVVPVTSGGTLWLYGLDGALGETLWRTMLCDEPPGGASPWAATVVAVQGRDVYLAAGTGLVLAVDGTSGAIRWAAGYRRDVTTSDAMRQMFGVEAAQVLDYRGWEDDVVIPHGRLLLVMASDGDRILALDRRTGERVWEAPRTSPLGVAAEYCLGVHGGSLYVAGRNVARRYEIATGRLLAEQPLENSLGHGCLTSDAVYLPVGESIWKLNLDLKPAQPPVPVVLSVDEPVGNLFSDGERLWGVGAGRFYALTTLESRLAALEQRIARGDATAQLERMRLYLKDGQREAALADLRGAFHRLRTSASADEAAKRVLTTLVEQRLPKEHPGVVLRLAGELFVGSGVETSPEVQKQLSEVVGTCINAMRQAKPEGAVTELLHAASLYSEDYLQTAASFAIDALAEPSDKPALLASLARGPAALQLISMRAAGRLAPEESKTAFARLLSASDPQVRLAAARALANLGERRGVLETLVALLASDNLAVRTRSYQTLQALSGQRIPFPAEGSVADRTAAARAWQQWVVTSGASARLSLPLADRALRLGRILVVTPSNVIELDSEKKERWRTRVAGAAWGCQGLPNGHRLVAIHSHSAVVEFDDTGKEVWKKDRLPGPPTSVERLENGNTLVTCPSASAIVEIAPDGKTTSLEVPGSPTWAARLDSGGTLVALEQPVQRVVEIDPSGRIIWEARTGGQAPVHAVRLENGNTLVTLSKARQVVEFDPTGQSIVWRTQVPLFFPSAAQRLPSGNTLVADQTGVREIDPSGREVKWQLRVMQVTGLSAF